MMSSFHDLSEPRSSETITQDDFERQRYSIFVPLASKPLRPR